MVRWWWWWGFELRTDEFRQAASRPWPTEVWGCLFSVSNTNTDVHFLTRPVCTSDRLMAGQLPPSSVTTEKPPESWLKSGYLDPVVTQKCRTLNVPRQKRVLVWSQAGSYMMNLTVSCLGKMRDGGGKRKLSFKDADDFFVLVVESRTSLQFSC